METLIIVDGKTLEYEGLFSAKELWKVIDQVFEQHKFDKVEFKNSEQVFKDGKQLRFDIRPYKKLSDYVKAEIKVILVAKNMKEVEITKKGITKKLYTGHVEIAFTAYLLTDYEHAWETKPFYYFIRMLIDKFVYRSYIQEAKAQIVSITNELYDEVRSYLNMQKFA